MIRIGKFTGRIYDITVDITTIGECCINVDEKSAFKDELLKKKFPLPECAECRGCPEYQNS